MISICILYVIECKPSPFLDREVKKYKLINTYINVISHNIYIIYYIEPDNLNGTFKYFKMNIS